MSAAPPVPLPPVPLPPGLTPAEPRCPHFGTCGGCQYQHIAYADQLTLKRTQLTQLLHDGGFTQPPAISITSAEPYHYRNRIRLRLQHVNGELRAGYNLRGTTDFLPITTCPIAAPILWHTAETLLALATTHRDAAFWLQAAAEVELFTNDALDRVQLTIFCAPRTRAQPGSFARFLTALQQLAPQVAGASANAFDPRTGPTGRTLDAHGAAGLSYQVKSPAESPAADPAIDEIYWVARGGFFQVNRFLLPALATLVTAGRRGRSAFDLFAGVGLFARLLAHNFAGVTAVEANPTATASLAAAFKKLSPNFRAVSQTTLVFLTDAVLQRERPDLVVLDPPRAGAGVEACALIARLAPAQIIYVSCDPATLVRDLRVLANARYRLQELHLIDLFPQTQHLETIAVLSLHPTDAVG